MCQGLSYRSHYKNIAACCTKQTAMVAQPLDKQIHRVLSCLPHYKTTLLILPFGEGTTTLGLPPIASMEDRASVLGLASPGRLIPSCSWLLWSTWVTAPGLLSHPWLFMLCSSVGLLCGLDSLSRWVVVPMLDFLLALRSVFPFLDTLLASFTPVPSLLITLSISSATFSLSSFSSHPSTSPARLFSSFRSFVLALFFSGLLPLSFRWSCVSSFFSYWDDLKITFHDDYMIELYSLPVFCRVTIGPSISSCFGIGPFRATQGFLR